MFHAATNVPAFIKAFSHLTSLRHLTISCPGQDPSQRYRRDIVDYALISLRIAIERSPLYNLSKLTLHRIHPSGLQYLRHLPGWGATPSASRRWRQIRKLKITMDSWEFGCTGMDHLKVLEDYIRGFSPSLERISFGWNGRKGPCPLTLFTDPLFAPPKVEKAKLFCEVTSPMSPLPAAPRRTPMHFPRLKYMQVRNATMSADQVSDFVDSHCETVKEFDFENVFLINGGLWEDALAPLSARMDGGSDAEWCSQQSGSELGSGSFSSSYPSDNDFERFMRDAIGEVIDEGICLDDDKEVDANFGAESDIPIAFEQMIARDSITVTKGREKKRVRRRKRKHNHPKVLTPAQSVLRISDPIEIPTPPLQLPVRVSRPVSIPAAVTEESPMLLQPTTFLQPSTFNPAASPKKSPASSTVPVLTINTQVDQLDPNIQGVQRNLAQDLRREEIANDPEKRVSALKKAREAVLTKLGKEFVRNHNSGRSLLFKNTCGGSGAKLGHSSSTLVPLMFSR